MGAGGRIRKGRASAENGEEEDGISEDEFELGCRFFCAIGTFRGEGPGSPGRIEVSGTERGKLSASNSGVTCGSGSKERRNSALPLRNMEASVVADKAARVSNREGWKERTGRW